jgi:hypothetical protein
VTDALRPVEQALVEHVERGELLDLAGDSPVDEEAMRGWDESRSIRAWVIRDILRGRLAPDPDPLGLRLRGACISGRLDVENVHSLTWLELYDCFLGEGLVARDAHLPGLVLTGSLLEHSSDVVLDATRLTCEVLGLAEATVRTDGDCAVDVSGARLGELNCTGAHLHAGDGPALIAWTLQCTGDVLLCQDFEATGAGGAGAVHLVGATIGGNLDCGGARLVNKSGPALHADGVRVERDARLRQGFDATADTTLAGAVNLIGAHVSGLLEFSGGKLVNDSGPALIADGSRVDLRVFCDAPFTSHGAGYEGGFRVPGAHFGGWQGDSAVMRNNTGPALVAAGLRVDTDLALTAFRASGGSIEATVNLNSVEVGGTFEIEIAELRNETDPQALLSVNGLVYRGLPLGLGIDEWLRLLRDSTPVYAAQPYQHLAGAYRAAGHDREARRILMAQRRDQISRALTGRGERAWARFTGLVLGYGYQPWRALLGLIAVLLTGAVLAVVLGGTGLAQVRAGAAPTACPVIDRIAVGLELGTPLISTPARLRCEATNTGAGQALTITGWILRLMAWAFATLFIAGFTGAVRKT